MSELGPTTDAELLQRWQAGDPASGGELFRRLYPAVVRFLRNKVDDSARDDLVQQTFMAGQTARFDGRSQVLTWLLAIAWRKTADYYRGRTRAERHAEDFANRSVVEMGESIESRLTLQAEQRLLLEGLRRLPLHQQAALELAYWEHLTAAQVAEVLEIPVGTAKTRLRDGRLRLTRELEQIATSDAVLKSTLDNLEVWADRVRAAVGLDGQA